MQRLRDPAQERLSSELLKRLMPLSGMEGAADPGRTGLPGRVFSYCCFEAERIRRVSTVHPIIGIVLSGQKEFWLAESCRGLVAGDVFVFPAGVDFDVVNIPDSRTNRYESLLVEIRQVPESVLRTGRPRTGRRMRDPLDIQVTLSGDLVDAIVHAAMALASSDHAEALGRHRLAEVLLLLRDQPAAACLFEASLADRVRWLVLAAPSSQWSAASVAREFGLGASTLRRHLAAEETSLRDVLVAARMSVAHDILANGEGDVTAAASVAGYRSRSHFVRHFRDIYGVLPKTLRRNGVPFAMSDSP